MALTDEQLAVLDFETRHPRWKYPGAKEKAVLTQLGLSLARYYQVLNHLLDDDIDALAHAPQTVHRLQRLREVRTRARRSSRSD